VKSLGRADGYLANAAVKILLPPSAQKLADTARNLGFGGKVDELILAMNRAAEQAAPLAAPHFASAIRGLGIRDVQAILKAGDTGATAFFERTTRTNLHAAFKPSVSQSIERAGAGRASGVKSPETLRQAIAAFWRLTSCLSDSCGRLR
jgi:hypothetical protein